MAGATKDDPAIIWWPSDRSTLQLASRKYLRVLVDPDVEVPELGKVFASKAAALRAEEDELTLVPPSPPGEVIEVELPRGGTLWVDVRRRSARKAPPFLISAQRSFGVADLGRETWAGVRVVAADEVDDSQARSHASEAEAAADREHSIRVPKAVGTYVATVVSPSGDALIAVQIEVRNEVTRETPGPVTPGPIVPADRALLDAAVTERRGIQVVPAGRPIVPAKAIDDVL